MHNSSITSTQEPSPLYDLVSQLGRFASSSRFHNLGSEGHSALVSNFLYFDGTGRNPRVSASLSLNTRAGGSSIRRIVTEFNRAIRFHCDKFPIGFASLGVGGGDNNGSDNGGAGDNNIHGLRENGCALNHNGVALNGAVADSPKKVLILMSDTGGGHRASAEAIKAAFNEQFGDEYQVSYLSLCDLVLIAWLMWTIGAFFKYLVPQYWLFGTTVITAQLYNSMKLENTIFHLFLRQ